MAPADVRITNFQALDPSIHTPAYIAQVKDALVNSPLGKFLTHIKANPTDYIND
jgi:hypothetical protein